MVTAMMRTTSPNAGSPLSSPTSPCRASRQRPDYQRPVHTVRLALANKEDAGNFARGALMLMQVLEPDLTQDERVDLIANLLSRYSKAATPNTVSSSGFDYEMVTVGDVDMFEARWK
jgi:hypothetical protein